MKMGCPAADGALHNFRNTGSCIMSRCEESCQNGTLAILTTKEQRPLDITKGWPITPRMKKMAGARFSEEHEWISKCIHNENQMAGQRKMG